MTTASLPYWTPAVGLETVARLVTLLFFERGEVMIPRGLEEDRAEFLASAATGPGGVAVRTEGDHLGRVVGTAEGQILYVIAVGAVLDVANAARVLATPSAAKKDRVTRVPGSDDVGGGSLCARRVMSRFRQKMSARDQGCL